jgi:hypothetical protein
VGGAILGCDAEEEAPGAEDAGGFLEEDPGASEVLEDLDDAEGVEGGIEERDRVGVAEEVGGSVPGDIHGDEVAEGGEHVAVILLTGADLEDAGPGQQGAYALDEEGDLGSIVGEGVGGGALAEAVGEATEARSAPFLAGGGLGFEGDPDVGWDLVLEQGRAPVDDEEGPGAGGAA